MVPQGVINLSPYSGVMTRGTHGRLIVRSVGEAGSIPA